MPHEIHRVVSFERFEAVTLRVRFADGSSQVIDFKPVLFGELYGALADAAFFGHVEVDEESHTLVWPNGADFDPAILHDWPRYGPELAKLAETW